MPSPLPSDAAPQSAFTRFARTALDRVVAVERGEAPALVWSFVCFFAVLASYYVIRPMRDEMSVAVGPDRLQWLFLIVFLVMLAAVPLFGWLVETAPKRRIAPLVYGFFIANLAVFWVLLGTGSPGPLLAGAFFVWGSVYNLFVVSLFWSVMSDTWSSAAAKRLYGFIAAGGSAGALAGPMLTQSLVHVLGPRNLLVVCGACLLVAVAAYAALGRSLAPAAARAGSQGGEAVRTSAPEAAAAGILGGAMAVLRSPYLGMIAAALLVTNLVSTFFYVEQARIVGAAITSTPDRVQLFARMDLAVSVATILIQVLLTGALMKRLGVGRCAAALPIVCLLALGALAASSTLPVIVAAVVAERAIAFAVANPATRVLYTVVPEDAKYKAQSFIDTVVYRGGDAASGWVFNLLRTAGVAMPAVAALTAPFVLLWLAIVLRLGREQEAKEAEVAGTGTAKDAG